MISLSYYLKKSDKIPYKQFLNFIYVFHYIL